VRAIAVCCSFAMTYAGSLRFGSSPDLEEIKQPRVKTSICGFIRLLSSGPSLRKPFC
jgi:hypothetical protein